MHACRAEPCFRTTLCAINRTYRLTTRRYSQSATFLQRLPVEIGGFDILEGSALIRVRSC